MKHLQTIQRQQVSMAVSADPGVVHKFRNGFSECVSEVSRYMGTGAEAGISQRLVEHLTSCVQQISTRPAQQPLSPEDINNNSASKRLQTLQLIPSRLPSGELALLLPNSHHSLFHDNQVSTTSESPVAVSSSRSSAFTAVTRDRSPLHSPISSTNSDCYSPTLPTEVSSTSGLPPPPISFQTPVTVITDSAMLNPQQRFLEVRSQQNDSKDPLDFSIKKDTTTRSFSPPLTYKRPFHDDSSDKLLIKSFEINQPLKMPRYAADANPPIIIQPERRDTVVMQKLLSNPFVGTPTIPNQFYEKSRVDLQPQQPSTSSRDMWRPW